MLLAAEKAYGAHAFLHGMCARVIFKLARWYRGDVETVENIDKQGNVVGEVMLRAK